MAIFNSQLLVYEGAEAIFTNINMCMKNVEYSCACFFVSSTFSDSVLGARFFSWFQASSDGSWDSYADVHEIPNSLLCPCYFPKLENFDGNFYFCPQVFRERAGVHDGP